jgi:hypothetical protein
LRNELFWQLSRAGITALELFLHCAAWRDPNTDKDFEQLTRSTWYVFPAGRYIERIDITAGCNCEDIYCGLLLRAIEGANGPRLALRKMVRGDTQLPAPHDWSWTPEEIKIIERIRGSNIFSSGPLRLIPRKEPFTEELSFWPRINLKYSEEPWNANLRVVVSVASERTS